MSFFSRTRVVIGLDFGHGVIRAAEVNAAAKGRPVLNRYHEIIVPKDAVKEGVVVDQEIVAAALRQLWADAGFTSKSVIIGMGSQQVLTRELVLPRMPLAQLRETLPFRVQELLPLPVEDAVLDFFPTQEIDTEDGPQVRGLLVAATREAVVANSRAVAAAGLTTIDVDLIPFAVSRVHLAAADASGTEVLLHVGAVSSSIVLSTNGVPQFVRVVPSGGEDVTAALAAGLGIDSERADELKRRIGMVDSRIDAEAGRVADITSDAVAELVRAVRSTLAFYRNSHPDVVVNGVVLSGGGAELRGFDRALAAAVELPVTAGRSADKFRMGPDVDEASFLAAGPAPAVALGLTMRSAA